MCAESVNNLDTRLTKLRDRRQQAEREHQTMLNRRGRPKLGLKGEESKLREKIAQLDAEIAGLEKKQSEASVPRPPSKPAGKPQSTTVVPPMSEGIQIRQDLDIILNSFVLRRKRSTQASVPVGRVFVLSYEHETFDHEGFPEVFLAGEMVTRGPHRRRGHCLVTELAEFPGKITITATQWLPGISQTEADTASVNLSFYVRLKDPIMVLKRTGGKWMREADRRAFNEKVTQDLEEWLRQMLAGRIQLWSAKEQEIYEQIFSALNSELGRIGLHLEPGSTGIIARRQYPPALYKVVFQFARMEQVVLEAISAGRRAAICQETKLEDEDLMTIQSIASRNEMGDGTGLFVAIKDKPAVVCKKVATWMNKHTATTASMLVRTLCSTQYSEREKKLTEQVLLAAFRNPMLAIGEWLQTERSAQSVSRFWHMQKNFEMA